MSELGCLMTRGSRKTNCRRVLMSVIGALATSAVHPGTDVSLRRHPCDHTAQRSYNIGGASPRNVRLAANVRNAVAANPRVGCARYRGHRAVCCPPRRRRSVVGSRGCLTVTRRPDRLGATAPAALQSSPSSRAAVQGPRVPGNAINWRSSRRSGRRDTSLYDA